MEAEETTVVPAGSFPMLRIACKNLNNDAWISTFWYAPAVKHIVREEVAVPCGRRVHELITYRVR